MILAQNEVSKLKSVYTCWSIVVLGSYLGTVGEITSLSIIFMLLLLEIHNIICNFFTLFQCLAIY